LIWTNAAVSLPLRPHPSAAAAGASEQYPASPGESCLADLPPVPPGKIRVYLCRHGQTEFNRLKKIQGARINAPLNAVGRCQAALAGRALRRILPPGGKLDAFHSPLLRAAETASGALSAAGPAAGSLTSLASLREIDFGSSEGLPDEVARAGIYAVYGAWGTGLVDEAMPGGGDTGRAVAERAAASIDALVEAARQGTSRGDVVVAVAHSAFIRFLLALLSDEPLISSYSKFKVDNGGITVLDVDAVRKLTLAYGSKVVGGKLSLIDKKTRIVFPETTIVRFNEVRHLST